MVIRMDPRTTGTRERHKQSVVILLDMRDSLLWDSDLSANRFFLCQNSKKRDVFDVAFFLQTNIRNYNIFFVTSRRKSRKFIKICMGFNTLAKFTKTFTVITNSIPLES